MNLMQTITGERGNTIKLFTTTINIKLINIIFVIKAKMWGFLPDVIRVNLIFHH